MVDGYNNYSQLQSDNHPIINLKYLLTATISDG